MTKKQFILKQISKTNKKNLENYVTTRIIHGINDLGVKPITQQRIIRPNGYALVDLYLPQIGIYIEINEYGHLAPDRQFEDRIRREDIVNATELHEIVIEENEDIENINSQIEEAIKTIVGRVTEMRSTGKFVEWDPERGNSPERFLEKGFIEVSDDAVFRTHVEVCRCFGLNYKGHQRAVAQHPFESNTIIWFPKLYPNSDWDNSITDDNAKITEQSLKGDNHVNKVLEKPQNIKPKRIVFAHVIDAMGNVGYRYKGVYQLNTIATKMEQKVIYDRISTRVLTYSQSTKRE